MAQLSDIIPLRQIDEDTDNGLGLVRVFIKSPYFHHKCNVMVLRDTDREMLTFIISQCRKQAFYSPTSHQWHGDPTDSRWQKRLASQEAKCSPCCCRTSVTPHPVSLRHLLLWCGVQNMHPPTNDHTEL